MTRNQSLLWHASTIAFPRNEGYEEELKREPTERHAEERIEALSATARNLLLKSFSPETISDVTRLSLEEVQVITLQ